jgi:hypothetical protein
VVQDVGIQHVVIAVGDMFAENIRVVVKHMLQLGTFVSEFRVDNQPRRYFDDWLVLADVFEGEHAWVLGVS